MRNLKNPWVDFHQTWYRGAPPGVDELIRFLDEIRPTSKVKGQWTWSKYAIFTSFYAKSQEPLGGFSSNLVQRCTQMNWLDFGRDPPNIKGQWTWSQYAIFTSLMRNLKNPWVDFHQTWYMDAPPGVDELIRVWARSCDIGGIPVDCAQSNKLVFYSFRQKEWECLCKCGRNIDTHVVCKSFLWSR